MSVPLIVVIMSLFGCGGGTTDSTPPTVPMNVSARASGSVITITWQAFPDPDGAVNLYNIQRCNGRACTGGSVIGTVDGSTTTFTDTSAILGPADCDFNTLNCGIFGYSVNAVVSSNKPTAYSTISYAGIWNFETGTWPSFPDSIYTVPPVVNSPGGNPNSYGRLTASPSDCGGPPPRNDDPCPMIREQVVMWTIPEVQGEVRSYSFDLRIPSAGQPATGHDSMLWQLLEPNGGTRSMWIGVRDFGAGERIYFANQVPPCPSSCISLPVVSFGLANVVDLGPLVFDQWITYQVDMTLAATPTNGSVTIWMNGSIVATITDQPTMYLVDTQDVKFDVLDWSGTLGIADFDNVYSSSIP